MLFFICFSFVACEKVIELDLADSESVIVIEATITNNKIPFKVLVSKTTSYFGEETDNPVSGATVSVRAVDGEPRYFEETEPGVYKLEKMMALTNHWYIVDVEYEGLTYSARSFMNEPVKIVDFGISYFEGYGILDSGYKVSCYLRDPANIENYYRLKYYVNGNMNSDQGNICVYTDKLFDGMAIGLSLPTDVSQTNDTLIIELQSIDKAAYDYFATLESISGLEIVQSASPTNPNSNFNNGALGYFSAYSFDQRKLVIKDYIVE